VFCQLERLRRFFPSDVRHILAELPESLDETYERLLKEIRKSNREDVRRLLHCLAVAVRPLRVMELAEVLAVDFNDAEGIPRLNPNWRWEDQERGLLSACSSLITIVEDGDARIVRFSHFSIEEFLTSDRLAAKSHEVSAYYINLEHAHTILGQACLGVLLRIHDGVDEHTPGDSSLARYAAEHWTTHAQFEDVSSRLHRWMEYLFDPDKPHFATWLTLNDIDTQPSTPSTFHQFTQIDKSPASPLYYVALCGFHHLVERLITKYPQDVNASGGYYVRPLVAALAKEHFQTADLLRQNGANPHVRIGDDLISPLHAAAYSENVKMVEKLIEYGADINAEDSLGRTPLYFASEHDNHGNCPVIRLLLELGANVNARAKDASTPLHVASRCGTLEVVRLMLEYGADPNVQDEDKSTPLHLASRCGHVNIARLLLERGADVNARDADGWTSLHQASRGGYVEVVQLLLDHGVDVNAQNLYTSTPPHLSSGHGHVDIPKALPEFDMEVDASSWSPLHLASQEGHLEVVRLLLTRGANLNVKTEDWHTPLFLASNNGRLEVVQILLENGADLDGSDLLKKTPLHGASENGHFEVILSLLDRGANVNAKDAHFWTPLHTASKTGNLKVARELLNRGADVEAQDDLGWTPLHLASQEGYREIVEVLLNCGAQVDARESDRETALHLAAYYGHLQTTKLLLDHGADYRARNREKKIPFELATEERHHKVAQLLSEFGFGDYDFEVER
jgi:ankyrin repeat protein